MKGRDTPVKEAQKVPIRMKPNRLAPRHSIIKMARIKGKERILRPVRERQLVTNKGAPIKLSAYFSTETLQDKRDWQKVFKVMKSKDLQQRLLYPSRLSSKMEGEIKSFPDQKKRNYRSSLPPNQYYKNCKETLTRRKE